MSEHSAAIQDPARRSSALLDQAAVTVSLVCLFHCLAVPVLLGVTPWLVPQLLAVDSFHLWALCIALPLAIAGPGRRLIRHRQHIPAVLAAAGLTLMVSAVMIHGVDTHDELHHAHGAAPQIWDRWLTVFGAALLGIAHLISLPRFNKAATAD